MEQGQGTTTPGGAELSGEEPARAGMGNASEGRTGPSWRGFALAILAAVVLSVTATLLLGGSWSFYALRPAAAGAGCGSGGPCCPPPEAGK